MQRKLLRNIKRRKNRERGIQELKKNVENRNMIDRN